MFTRRKRAGFSLIEVVVTIVVLGIGLAGLLAIYNQVTRASVDPMVRKQALAIASSLLEEVELKAFTHCDPDDATVLTADPPTVPCVTAEALGPEGCPGACETRYSATNRFDNVNDYHQFRMGSGTPDPDIKTINGTVISQLADYSASVTVASSSDLGVAAGAELKINVVVSHVPSGTTVQLQGYRLRYAPNTP